MRNKQVAVIVAGLALCGAARGVAADKANPASLYERLGGMPAIQAVIDRLWDRIVADNRINAWFAHAAADPARAQHYKTSLGALVCQAAGGPCTYTGPDMAIVHQGRAVTEEAFNAMVDDIAASLDDLHMPENEKAEILALLAPLKAAVVAKK